MGKISKMIQPKDYASVVNFIKRKLKIDSHLANKVIQYAAEKGINILKLQANMALLSTFLRIVEEVKLESVLKWELNGQALLAAKKLQKTIDDPDAVPIKDLHITLASGPEWKKMRKRLFHNSFTDPKFRIDFDEVTKISQGNRTSWYARIRQQKEMSGFVEGILGKNPDHGRVFHVSLCNLTGKSGDSVALVEDYVIEKKDRDYKAEYKKFQSSEKMRKYRAELNKYNREKGTYGNGDGKDASHKDGKIIGFEKESKNKGRAEKSRLKGSKRKK